MDKTCIEETPGLAYVATSLADLVETVAVEAGVDPQKLLELVADAVDDGEMADADDVEVVGRLADILKSEVQS